MRVEQRPRFSVGGRPLAPLLTPFAILAVSLTIALAIAFLPPLYSGLGVVAIIAGALILINPVWGAYALVLSVPVQRLVSFNAGPVEITITQSLFVFVLGVWWAWIAVRQARHITLTPIAVGLILFVMAGMLPSLFATTSLADSMAEISRWFVTILSYVIVVNSPRTRREMNVLIVVMLFSAMSEALLGVIQAYAGIGPESFIAGPAGEELVRAYGTIGAPNSFAGYINMSLPLALALAVYLWARWYSDRRAAPLLDRPSYTTFSRLWLPTLISLVALFLFWTLLTTLSRGAWIGLALGVLVMVVCLGRRAAGALSVLFVGMTLLVVLGFAGVLPAAITDRFGQLVTQISIFDPRGVTPTPENYALVERMVHWQVAGNMFLSSPWVGVGIGNFNTLFNKFGVQGWPFSRGHAHNYYLNVLAETGIIGETFYLLMLIIAVVVGVRALRRINRLGDGYGQAVVIGALGVLVTFMGHNFFENLHALNFGIHWGAALALFSLVFLPQEAQGES